MKERVIDSVIYREAIFYHNDTGSVWYHFYTKKDLKSSSGVDYRMTRRFVSEKQYYPNGVLKAELYYDKGVPHGKHSYYHQQNYTKSKTEKILDIYMVYENGKLVETSEEKPKLEKRPDSRTE